MVVVVVVVVVDYGDAIKDLAAADIFTGDMLLKNFGVTRQWPGHLLRLRRAVPACPSAAFAAFPPPTSLEDEFAAEPWFHVGEQ